MIVDNFKLIRDILKFRSGDDFYFLQILQRKKDHPKGAVNGTNNNSRLVKAYFISSFEYFDFIKPEVTKLCDVFGARAYINLNRRSYEKMSFHLLKKVTDQICNKEFNKAYKAYHTVCGEYVQESDKLWILDDDIKFPPDLITYLGTVLSEIQPHGPKIKYIIPTLSGQHIITSPFNLKEAKSILDDFKLDVHKNNPTILYISNLVK